MKILLWAVILFIQGGLTFIPVAPLTTGRLANARTHKRNTAYQIRKLLDEVIDPRSQDPDVQYAHIVHTYINKYEGYHLALVKCLEIAHGHVMGT